MQVRNTLRTGTTEARLQDIRRNIGPVWSVVGAYETHIGECRGKLLSCLPVCEPFGRDAIDRGKVLQRLIPLRLIM